MKINFEFVFEPIFDKDLDVYGYELLTRFDNGLMFKDLTMANSLFVFKKQIDDLFEHKKLILSSGVFISLNVNLSHLKFLLENTNYFYKARRLTFLRFEVCEDFLDNYVAYNEIISAFSDFDLWLDDFSSLPVAPLLLEQLTYFRVIKIDRFFFWENAGKKSFEELINVLYEHNFSLICEGIDSVSRLEYMDKNKMSAFQGFLVKSVSFEDVLNMASRKAK
ncbi:TPA: EAL domain-containing protein [Citrobacter koseri]|nr:EAL domain-containing protein [Citrobacter koseri]